MSARLTAWMPAVGWAAFIFSMSTDEMSAEHTRSWIEPILRFVFPGISPSAVVFAHFVIRKLAHVSEYLVFAILVDRAWRRDAPLPAAPAPLAGLVIAALYSLGDEGHQMLVPSRGASLLDCGFDTFGAAIGSLVAWRGQKRGQTTFRCPPIGNQTGSERKVV